MAQTEHLSQQQRPAVAIAGGPAGLGELLRQHRERRGWSQEELSARVEPVVSTNTISNLERGRTRPYRHTLAALCDALGLDAAERQQVEAAWHASVSTGTTQRAPMPDKPEILDSGVSGRRLPTPLTPLIGREQELQAIVARLAPGGARLLTLVGPG
jgi:transcriptional regulator with XRE-family HTH domain